MKKIAIIGANSSLAKSFILYLDKKQEVELKLYDIQPSDSWMGRQYQRINFMIPESLDLIDYDCDLMYIFSGLTGTVRGFDNYADYIDINEKGLVSLLNCAAQKQTGCRIIYPSSRLVYKSIGKQLSEESELECRSIYAVNKMAAEQYIRAYGNVFGLTFTIFRIAIPFGTVGEEEARYGIVSVLKEQAEKRGIITLYGGGEGLRTFTHIEDICDALYRGGSHEKTKNGIFNIGGYTCSLKELAERIAVRYRAEIQTVPWPELYGKVEVPDGWLNSRKLDGILNMKYRNFDKENF